MNELVWDRDTGLGVPPTKNKHRLFVAQTCGFGPSTHIYFQCRYCVANLQVERSMMEALLAGKRSSFLSSGIWNECQGR